MQQLDPQNRITDILNITYDPAGNKTKITKTPLEDDPDDPEEGESLTFTYDALNQLQKVIDHQGQTRSYYYDTLGNRIALIEQTAEGTSKTLYHYNSLNQLTRILDQEGSKELTYDKRGNLTRIRTGGPQKFDRYTYDAANRLVEVTNGHGDKTEYTYNGFGQRVKATVTLDHGANNNNRKPKDKYFNDNGNKYGWVDGLPPGLAKKPGWIQQHKRTKMETHYVIDMLSPTQDILLSYGEQVQIQRFTYGHEVLSMHFQSLGDHDSGWVPEGDESAYTGYDYDYFAGLYYANARYYLPEIGRFISPDPLYLSI